MKENRKTVAKSKIFNFTFQTFTLNWIIPGAPLPKKMLFDLPVM